MTSLESNLRRALIYEISLFTRVLLMIPEVINRWRDTITQCICSYLWRNDGQAEDEIRSQESRQRLKRHVEIYFDFGE